MPLISQKAALRFIHEVSPARVSPRVVLQAIMDIEAEYRRRVEAAEAARVAEGKARELQRLPRKNPNLELHHWHKVSAGADGRSVYEVHNNRSWTCRDSEPGTLTRDAETESLVRQVSKALDGKKDPVDKPRGDA